MLTKKEKIKKNALKFTTKLFLVVDVDVYRRVREKCVSPVQQCVALASFFFFFVLYSQNHRVMGHKRKLQFVVNFLSHFYPYYEAERETEAEKEELQVKTATVVQQAERSPF